MGTPALYAREQIVVDVIQDGDYLAFVKFPDGKRYWVKSNLLVFDDDCGPWNDDFEEHEMNPDDCAAGDQYDMEYDR